MKSPPIISSNVLGFSEKELVLAHFGKPDDNFLRNYVTKFATFYLGKFGEPKFVGNRFSFRYPNRELTKEEQELLSSVMYYFSFCQTGRVNDSDNEFVYSTISFDMKRLKEMVVDTAYMLLESLYMTNILFPLDHQTNQKFFSLYLEVVSTVYKDIVV